MNDRGRMKEDRGREEGQGREGRVRKDRGIEGARKEEGG